jgi:hypothetical protein
VGEVYRGGKWKREWDGFKMEGMIKIKGIKKYK